MSHLEMANPGCKQFAHFKADAACVAKLGMTTHP